MSEKLFFRAANVTEPYDKVEYVNRLHSVIKNVNVTDLKQRVPKISTGEIDIRTSTIENAGNGGFANRDFDVDEIITYYEGRIVDQVTADRLKAKTHHKSIVTGGLYVIVGNLLEYGDDEELITNPKETLQNKGIGAYLNDPLDEDKTNVEFIIVDSYENQQFWVNKLKYAQSKDTSNKVGKTLLVRDLMPIFDLLLRTLSPQMLKGKFDIKNRIIIVKAIKKINKGDELFVSYSSSSWESKHHGGIGNTLTKCCFECKGLTMSKDEFTSVALCSTDCQLTYYDRFPHILHVYQSPQ
jgi:hypothetical protein